MKSILNVTVNHNKRMKKHGTCFERLEIGKRMEGIGVRVAKGAR